MRGVLSKREKVLLHMPSLTTEYPLVVSQFCDTVGIKQRVDGKLHAADHRQVWLNLEQANWIGVK